MASTIWPCSAALTLGGAHLVVAVEPQLGVERFEGRQIGLHLLGQLAHVTLTESAHPLLQVVEPRSGFAESGLEKGGGARSLPLANLRIFLDVERREGVGHERHGLRIAALIGEREGRRGRSTSGLRRLELETKVLPHDAEDLLARHVCAQVRVKTEAVDDTVQA